ncbi:MAG: TlpA disulfide reductase family protein [Acidobacteriota bacterium]
MRSSRSLPVLVALLALLVSACSEAPEPRTTTRAKTKKKGLDLSLRSLDGRALDLVDLRGKVVLVDVWATWCRPCIQALPGLIELNEKHSDELVVVGLSVDTDRQALANFLQANELPYFNAYADEEAHRTFPAMALPTVYILDPDGRRVDRVVGAVSKSTLLQRARAHVRKESS